MVQFTGRYKQLTLVCMWTEEAWEGRLPLLPRMLAGMSRLEEFSIKSLTSSVNWSSTLHFKRAMWKGLSGIPKSKRSRKIQKICLCRSPPMETSSISEWDFPGHAGPHICSSMPLHNKFLPHLGHRSPAKCLSVPGTPQGPCGPQLYFCPPLKRAYFTMKMKDTYSPSILSG